MSKVDSSDADEDVIDDFLAERGLDEEETWDESYNKKQCPDCSGIHDTDATECDVCGWSPPAP